MDEEKPTHRPGLPTAAHLPARGMDLREETSHRGGPDLMAVSGDKRETAAWVLRVCGRPGWAEHGRAPRVDRLALLTSTTPSTEAPMGILEDVMKALERIPAWKRLQQLPERADALEQRIAALEQQLKPASGSKCPSCGAMALKLTKSTPSPEPWGSMGARQDHLQCQSCNYSDIQERNPGS